MASGIGDPYVYIKDVILVLGKNPQVPYGYCLIDTDLNSGNFFGRSIYLCYSTTEDEHDAIKALQVVAGSSPYVTTPTGYTKLDQDLNENVGGNYVYLCKLKGENIDLRPLTGLMVVTGPTRHTYPHDHITSGSTRTAMRGQGRRMCTSATS